MISSESFTPKEGSEMIKRVVLVGALFCLVVGLVMSAQQDYEDTGCYQTYESHGCNDSGSSCLCWQSVTYERYGMPGRVPLPIEVEAHAQCEYVHLWIESCDDHETESGSGRVLASASCYIAPLFAGNCYDDECYCSCSEE